MEFETVRLLARLLVGAFGSFCAILLWARTRDPAWVLAVTGVLAAYEGIIFDALAGFGLAPWEEETVFGLPVGGLVRAVLENLPTLLFGAAFLVVVARQRVR